MNILGLLEAMNLYTYLRNALWLSAIGIYFHAISIAIVFVIFMYLYLVRGFLDAS